MGGTRTERQRNCSRVYGDKEYGETSVRRDTQQADHRTHSCGTLGNAGGHSRDGCVPRFIRIGLCEWTCVGGGWGVACSVSLMSWDIGMVEWWNGGILEWKCVMGDADEWLI